MMFFSKSAVFFGVLLCLTAVKAFGQATEDCGYENGVQRFCGNGYAWVFGRDSYSVEGNHLFGESAPDAQWEYVSKGWNGSSCEQNKPGIFVAAPNITIRQSESSLYRNLYFSLPVTILLETEKLLPNGNPAILQYELVANGKSLIPPRGLYFDSFTIEQNRKFASFEDVLTGKIEVKNEELRNVKLVIRDLIQKKDPSRDFYCYRFDIILGKGRIDLLQ